MRRTGVFFAAVSLLLLAASAQTEVLFKQKVKIPFALQSGAKVVKPGEYLVTVKLEAGHRLLTLASSNRQVLRTFGEYATVPKKERDLKK